jgi:uncharacterized membrane protein SirB2
MSGQQPVQRSWLEVQWRKWKNPPQPVFRAVAVNLTVAIVGGLLLMIYALAAPSADLAPWIALYVVVVLVSGSVATYLWVKLPSGASGERRRSLWSGVLGLFAAVPIAYIVLVVVFQVLLGR